MKWREQKQKICEIYQSNIEKANLPLEIIKYQMTFEERSYAAENAPSNTAQYV